MVAPPAPAGGGSQTAFTYSSEPQAVPPKQSVRAKYREDAGGAPPDASQWIDENEVNSGSRPTWMYCCSPAVAVIPLQ